MTKQVFKALITFQRPTFHPLYLISAGASTFTVLIIGYVLHNLAFGSFASLGVFTLVYYRPLPYRQFLKQMSLIGLFLLLANLSGMLSTLLPWTMPFVIALVAFSGRFVFRLAKMPKPGVFFPVMVAAMATNMSISLAKMPIMSFAIFLGILIALLAGSIMHAVEQTPFQATAPRLTFQKQLAADPQALLDSLFYAAILFIVVYLSHCLQLQNSYWMVISCAAILQGDNLRAVMQRNVQRIVGSTVGLVIAAVLLNLHLPALPTIFAITILFILVENFVRRNYAVANFFTTPLALLLATLARQQYVFTLIQFRFLGIVLGSLVGLLAAWIMMSSLQVSNRASQVAPNTEKNT